MGKCRAVWAGPSPAPPHLSPLLLLPQLPKEQRELRWEQKFLSEMKIEHNCELGERVRDSAHAVGIPGHDSESKFVLIQRL